MGHSYAHDWSFRLQVRANEALERFESPAMVDTFILLEEKLFIAKLIAN